MNEDYFIEKIKAIPENKIISGKWLDAKGGRCMMAHCGRYGPYQKTEESIALEKIIPNWNAVNDTLLVYNQPTPKQRWLAALQDAKNKRIANELINSILYSPKNKTYGTNNRSNNIHAVHP